MKTRSSSLGTESIKLDAQSPPNTGRRTSLSFLPKFFRRVGNKSPTQTKPDVGEVVSDGTLEEVLSFEQNLEKGFLSEASLQLLEREKHMFEHTEEETDAPLTTRKEEEVSQLLRDREALLQRVEETIKKSLTSGEDNVDTLSSAVKAVNHEENQDKYWEKEGESQTRPQWRPSGWGKRHDSVLQNMVTERLKSAQKSSPERQMDKKDQELSSIQREIYGVGRLIKEDLLMVVKTVKTCYPEEMDICNRYARLYHQAFRDSLRDVAAFGLDEKDCGFILRWSYEHYPNILKGDELNQEINQEALGTLLPRQLILPLEDQYIYDTKVEVKAIIDKILDIEKGEWLKGAEPGLLDGCYSSPLAIDTLQCVNGAVESAKKHMKDPNKALEIVTLLEVFLKNYKQFQEDVVQGSSINSRAVIMASLACVEQFRESIAFKTNLFSEDLQMSCLSIVAEMKTTGNDFLLSPAHKEMKSTFRNIGTPEWLRDNSLFKKLLDQIKKHIEDLRRLSPPSHQDLMGRFHLDVVVEYMGRLLRVKVKLKDKTKQQEAAAIISQEVKELQSLFTGEGSREEWLEKLMLRVADVIQLQDVPSMQIAVASLGNDYPDLSIKQVSALLKLKTNLSKTDRRKVKTILENRAETKMEDVHPFFSKVHLS